MTEPAKKAAPPAPAKKAAAKKAAKKVEKRELKIAQTLDPSRDIPGTSEYLDDVERRNAEVARARVEDREPDLKNPPATQGTPMVSVVVGTEIVTETVKDDE